MHVASRSQTGQGAGDGRGAQRQDGRAVVQAMHGCLHTVHGAGTVVVPCAGFGLGQAFGGPDEEGGVHLGRGGVEQGLVRRPDLEDRSVDRHAGVHVPRQACLPVPDATVRDEVRGACGRGAGQQDDTHQGPECPHTASSRSASRASSAKRSASVAVMSPV